MNDFDRRIMRFCGRGLHSTDIKTIQVNLGFVCNQSCQHCHVEASPERTESMTWVTMLGVLEATRCAPHLRFDLTGGAPELNPHFRRLVSALRLQSREVQVRTNLTVLLEQGMEDLPELLSDHRVSLMASLPCYLEENVTAQRGRGIYERSIDALRLLNGVGYGRHPDLALNLVYNPTGPFLPPAQAELEADYRAELRERFGVEFTRLLTITNMPVGRFMRDLRRMRGDADYLELLKNSFNPETVEGLMCRHQISVGWDGRLFDCDFNLALDQAVDHSAPSTLDNLSLRRLSDRPIVTGQHCFGCTAGAGSSCGGALV